MVDIEYQVNDYKGKMRLPYREDELEVIDEI
jgi:hypothetical protein